MSSWFSKNALLEKLILYFIDKSPLNIDPKNLNVANGLFKFKDVNLNSNEIANGSVASISIQISGGLMIEAEGTDLIVSSPGSPTKSSTSSHETDEIDSFTITKSVMDLANSVMISIDEVSKQEILQEEELKNSANQGMPNPPSKSVIESMRNKIIDMALSNLQIKLNNTRILFLESGLTIDIEFIELQTVERTRILNIQGVSIVDTVETESFEDDEDNDIMMESSIYMSAMSNIKTQKSALAENKTLILKDITMSFTGINDMHNMMPKDVRVDAFDITYNGQTVSVDSFKVLVNKNLSRTLLSVDTLCMSVISKSSDPAQFVLNGVTVELLPKPVPNFNNNIGIRSLKVKHPHFTGSVQAADNLRAISVILKPQNKIEIKAKTIEVTLKPYRLSTALLLKIPTVSMGYNNNVFKGNIRTCSVVLYEDLSGSTRQSQVVMLKNTEIKFEKKKAYVTISDLFGSFCCDAFHSFVQTCIDINYNVTFPESLKYAPDLTQKVNLSDILNTDYYSPQTHSFKKEPKNKNTNHNGRVLGRFRLDKNYLDNIAARNANSSSASTAEAKFPTSIEVSLSVSNTHIQLYDGYEWEHTRSSICKKLTKPSGKKEVLFGSIYFDPAESQDAPDFIFKSVNEAIQNDGQSGNIMQLQKTAEYKGLIKMKDLKLDFFNYAVDFPTREESDGSGDLLNRLKLKVQLLEVFDNVPTSNWNKFLTSYKNSSSVHHYNHANTPMVSFQLENVRPVDYLYATELKMFLDIVPLKLHIHEDMLDFLVRFFTFKDKRFELIDEYPDMIFLQKFEMHPLKINIDFKAVKNKNKGFRSKLLNELKTILVVESSEVLLKHVVAYGMDGFDVLAEHLKAVWLDDIMKTQRLGVLNGVAPVKSMMTLGSGMKALVDVPRKEYTDQGLLRSFQKGVNVFGRTTSTEIVRLGMHLTTGTQNFLESTEASLKHSLQPSDEETLLHSPRRANTFLENEIQKSAPDLFAPHRPTSAPFVEQKNKSLYSDQPSNTHEGLVKAYDSVGKNFSAAFELAKQAKKEVSNAETNKEAAIYLAKTTPVMLLRPLIGATEALSKTLQGINNAMDDDSTHNEQARDKYKSSRDNLAIGP